MRLRTKIILLAGLMLTVVVAGRFATDYLGNKSRQEIIRESQASVFTLSIYVSTTINVIENAVKALSDSPWIAPALLAKGQKDIEQANSVLDRYSANFSSISYLMDAVGITVASSNRNDPDSLVGNSYGFRPYFQEAAKGQASHYFAMGITTGKRGFYASCPVKNHSGEVIGVVTMKKDIDEIETFFSKYPYCFLISPDGIVFLSSTPAMVTNSLWPLDKAVREALIASRQFGNNLSEAFIKKEIIDGMEVVLENNNFFVSRKMVDSDGWSIVLLTPTDRIRHYRLIGVLATISVSFLIMVFSGIIYVTYRSKEAFRQSEESKRLLLHAVGDGIFGVDTTGHVTFVNPAALRMLGFAEEEMFSQNVHNLIHHSHEDGTIYPIEDCPMSASFTHVADSHVTNGVFWRKDGKSFPVEYSSMPITKDGKVMGAVVRFTDITKRKQVEEALLSENKIIDAILDSAPGIIYLYNDQAKLVRWNKKHEQMTGYSSEELYGKDVLNWFKGDENSLSAVTNGLKNTLENGFGEAEADLQRKDGSKIPMYFTACPLTMDDKPYFVGIGIDISVRKSIDEERTLLSSVVEQAEENVLITDDRRTIIYINPAFERSSGYSCEELKGQKLRSLRSEHHGIDFYHTTKKILDRGEVWMGTIINKGKNGVIFEIEGTISPIRNASGAITHYVAVGRNMSRFRRLEKELQQAQKLDALGTLAGGIAHDFNNVLSAIMGYIELELSGASEGSKTRHRMERAFSACCRARDLIKQILSFSHQSEQQRKPIEISLIIQDAIKMLRATLPTTIYINFTQKSDESVILGDPTQIHQIIVNLCTNAAHAMRNNGGILEIGLYNVEIDAIEAAEYIDLQIGSYVRIVVRDTGQGMDSKILERIFEPFFTTKGPGEGSGIGLSVVHGIVKSHGGRIVAYSELGKGSTFEIFFPRTESVLTPDDSPDVLLPTGSERILLVDDEEMLVSVTTDMLKMLGYEVVSAKRSLDALELFRSQCNHFNLVITDLTMPEMTGLELAPELLRIRVDIPIILCTGFTSGEIREKAKSIGIREIMMKPYNISELSQKIRTVLDEA